MEIIKVQYQKIEKYLPRQRGNVKIENLQLINAVLYVAENGCKWRALPKRYGKWHTEYTCLNRWSKNDVLQRVFEALQQERIIEIKVESVCVDSTTVKVKSVSGSNDRFRGVFHRNFSQTGGQRDSGKHRKRRAADRNTCRSRRIQALKEC